MVATPVHSPEANPNALDDSQYVMLAIAIILLLLAIAMPWRKRALLLPTAAANAAANAAPTSDDTAGDTAPEPPAQLPDYHAEAVRSSDEAAAQRLERDREKAQAVQDKIQQDAAKDTLPR